MIKTGELTPNSQSDFDTSKKVKYVDEASPMVSDEKNKHKLIKPKLYIPSAK